MSQRDDDRGQVLIKIAQEIIFQSDGSCYDLFHMGQQVTLWWKMYSFPEYINITLRNSCFFLLSWLRRSEFGNWEKKIQLDRKQYLDFTSSIKLFKSVIELLLATPGFPLVQATPTWLKLQPKFTLTVFSKSIRDERL